MNGPQSDPSDYDDLDAQLDAPNEPKEVRDTRHLLGMFLNLCLWLMAAVFCASLVAFSAANSSFFEDVFLLRFSLAMLLVYGLYLAETLTSDTFQTLFWATSPHKLHSYIAFVRARDPQLLLRCRSYSLQDRFDRLFNGPMRKRLDWSYYQREFDFRRVPGETREFVFEEATAEDLSDGTASLNRHSPFVNVTFEYKIEFGDSEVAARFQQWRTECQKQASGMDSFVELQDVRRMPGMLRHFRIRNERRGDLSTHWVTFLLVSTLLLISWPYRLWVEDKIADQTLRFHKVLVNKKTRQSDSIEIVS